MVSTTRQRLNRFKPRSEIKWLTHPERATHRNSVAVLNELATVLQQQRPLSSQQEALITTLSQSSAYDTRLNAAWQMAEKTEAHYAHLLAGMAPYDLTAYHELINPHEPPAAHHIYLCEHLMKVEAGEIALLSLALCPGSAKSTYTSRSFAQWLIGLHPDDRVLALGHSQLFAESEFSKPNRAVVESDAFHLAFPDVFLHPKEQGPSQWKLDGWRGSYTCRGALAGVSGLRAKWMVGDDLYKNAADALSPTVNGNIWRWLAVDLLPRKLPECPLVLVNTRWASGDAIGRLQALSIDDPKSVPQPAVFINIPAEAGTDDPLGRKEGEWLWSEFYSANHYETIRATMPPSLWSALYLGKPLDQHGEYISEDQFQRFQAIPSNSKDEPQQWTKTVISVDTAQKGQERSDYSAAGVYRRRVDGRYCLIDVWRGKRKMDDLIRILSKLALNWEANYFIIENAGMGTQIIENYQGKMVCPIVEYEPGSKKGAKEFRFDAHVEWLTTGKVLLPEQAPWLTDFINELVAFPYGENDDQVDMFSQFCHHELKTKRGGTKRLRMTV